MPPLREVLAELGFEIDTKSLEKAKTGLGKVAAQWKIFAGVIAAGAGVQRLGAFLQGMAQAGDQTAKLGESLGLSARQVAQWQDAFARAGGQAEQFGDSYKTLAKFINDARKGGEDQLKSLRQLGVRLRDNRGRLRDTAELYDDVAIGLGKIENSARRAAIAEQAFGGQGLTMIRIGLAGRDALEAQRAEFDRLYGGTFERYIEKSKAQVAASDNLGASWGVLRKIVAEKLLSAFTWLTVQATRVVNWFARMTRNTKIFETTLIVLGTVAAGVGVALTAAFAGPIAVVAAIAAAILAVILVVEDLWQLFTGGKSAIGGALDAMFGFGSAKSFVEAMTTAFRVLWSGIRAVGNAIVWTASLLVRFGEGLGEAIYEVVNAVPLIMDQLSKGVDALWQGLKDAWNAVSSTIERGIDRLLTLIDRVVKPVRDLYQDAKDLLGLGDDEDDVERGRLVPPRDVPQVAREVRARFVPRELPVGASRPSTLGAPARGASSVRVDQPVNIQVNGAQDPGAVGDAIRRILDDRDRSTLEYARDLLLGIPG